MLDSELKKQDQKESNLHSKNKLGIWPLVGIVYAIFLPSVYLLVSWVNSTQIERCPNGSCQYEQ